MKIVHYAGSWPTNIGNAFIDYGAKAMYEAAFPGCEVVFISSFKDYLGKQVFHKGIFEFKDYLDIDIFSIGGCCLGYTAIESHYESIIKKLRIKNPNMKVIVPGAGMWDYGTDMQTSYKIIDKIKPDIFISRDTNSFTAGRNIANAYDGIDCGFFMDPNMKEIINFKHDYVAAADCPKQNIPKDEKLPGAYAYHTMNHPYNYEDNNFISDMPFEYLSLYKNAKRVYSHRVHACVAAIAFNVPTQLMNNLGMRESLFDKVGVENIHNMSLVNRDAFEKVKSDQITFLRDNL